MFVKVKIFTNLYYSLFLILGFSACSQQLNDKIANYTYYNKPIYDTLVEELLFPITCEEEIEAGVKIAYINNKGDTIIPFGKYLYLGTDTLKYYANVVEIINDSIVNRWIAIDRNQNILFELVSFENGPDIFHEGLVRVIRNRKMGFANQYGQIVIPCIYDYVWWFENGIAQVTLKSKIVKEKHGEHESVVSDQWFFIDKNGKIIEDKTNN